MPLAVERSLRAADVKRGAYLLDGKRLMWVAGVFDGEAALENCLYPNLPLQVKSVKDLLKGGWRLVRPA